MEPLQEPLPNISQLTSNESMNDIPIILDTLVLEGKDIPNTNNNRPNWQNLYSESRRLNDKLRLEHQKERDGLVKENLTLHQDNQRLGSALSDTQVSLHVQLENLKVLAKKHSDSQNEIEGVKRKIADLELRLSKSLKDDALVLRNDREMRARLRDLSELAKNQKSTIGSLKKSELERLAKDAKLLTEKQDAENALRKLREEVQGLDHVLEVYKEVVEGILGRKREFSKPLQQRDHGIIEKGEKIAHGGTCLADAYQIMSGDRADLRWYEEHYGTSPDNAIKFERSQAFRKLLDMRYELYRYRNIIGDAINPFEEDFKKLLEVILLQNYMTGDLVQMFLVGEEVTFARTLYQKLRFVWINIMNQQLLAS